MRFGLIVAPTTLPDLRPAPGTLDSDLVRARLPQPDVAIEVVEVDPQVDVAEQIDGFFEAHRSGVESILFYASTFVALAPDGEVFLCLDPTNPDVGDSLRDIAAALREKHEGPLLFVLDCRHAADEEDPFRSATMAGAIRAALEPTQTGIELLVAAQQAPAVGEDSASPFTRAFLTELDETDPSRRLFAVDLYRRILVSERLLGVVPCFAHTKGREPFVLVNGDGSGRMASMVDPGEMADVRPVIGPPPAIESRPILESQPHVADAAPEQRDESARSGSTVAEEETESAGAAPDDAGAVADVKVADPVRERDAEVEREAALPKVMISERPPPRTSSAPPRAASEPPREAVGPTPSEPPREGARDEAAPKQEKARTEPPPPKEPTYADHVAAGDALAARDGEAALAEYKKALLLVTPAQKEERAHVYVRVGRVKLLQDKRREAISNFEKATQLSPSHRPALEEIAKLSVEERDWRGVAQAEEKLLSTVEDPEERFARLVEFGERWASVARDAERARSAFSRAREIKPQDLGVLSKLLRIHEEAGAHEEAFALRVEIADRSTDARERAEMYAALGRTTLEDRKDEEGALAFFEKALDADPERMEPLAKAAEILAHHQEWSELETTYRRMLARTDRIPETEIRRRVRSELNRLLALLFRDHLEDPEAALRALEKAIADKPDELATRQTAVALARELGKWDVARKHLQQCAQLDPMVVQTYHDLFDVFQKLKRPDQAWLAASVTSQLGHADERERFIYEEGRTDGPPKPTRALGVDGWDLLRDGSRDHAVEDVLEAITKAAIDGKLADLRAQGRLPALDPALKQDPKKSTVSIVRSFAWAGHLLGVPMPAVYLRDDAQVGLASVIAEEPSVIAGAGVLRGKTLTELAFAAGRHLGYHVGAHRLLLYYPVIDDLAACFLAAVRIVMPDATAPAKMEKAALAMQARIEPLLDAKARGALERAVLAFDAAGSRADLGAWVAAVERCSTRAGYLLANDLRTTATSLAAEGAGMLSVEQKMVDLLWFTVSEEFHGLRDALGIAIEP